MSELSEVFSEEDGSRIWEVGFCFEFKGEAESFTSRLLVLEILEVLGFGAGFSPNFTEIDFFGKGWSKSKTISSHGFKVMELEGLFELFEVTVEVILDLGVFKFSLVDLGLLRLSLTDLELLRFSLVDLVTLLGRSQFSGLNMVAKLTNVFLQNGIRIIISIDIGFKWKKIKNLLFV